MIQGSHRRAWPAALMRIVVLFALLGQIAAAVPPSPRAPLPPQAQAIVALFGADALCLGDAGDHSLDHSAACVACPAHCGAVAPGSGPVATIRRAPMVALVAPPATAPPGPARPQSDLTAHGPPAALS